MLIREAIEALDGHRILSVKTAKEVCETLAIPFDETLIMSWQTEQEALQKYGFFATVAPRQGVEALRLSYHITKAYGLGAPGYCYIGVGKQAQANQQAIRQHLSEVGKL